jgi:hypothetical protein
MSAAPPKEKSMIDKLSEGITSAFNTAGTEAMPVAQGTPVVTTTAEPVEPAK